MADIVLADLEHYCTKAGSQKAAAKKLKISTAYLNDMLHGRRSVSEAVAAKLGWKLVQTWVRA